MLPSRRLPVMLVVALCVFASASACSPASEREDSVMSSDTTRSVDGGGFRSTPGLHGTFCFAIGDGALKAVTASGSPVFGVVVLDGEEASTVDVDALRRRGSLVLAYLSVGTIEPERSWYPDLQPYRLERWEDWGEYYADVSDPGFRSVISRDIAPEMLAKGFDGLFLDNVDMVVDHPEQADSMETLLNLLAGISPTDVLMAQNGDDAMGRYRYMLDGWNREDVTFTYDFETEEYVRVSPEDHAAALEAIVEMRSHGLYVTTTDYVANAGSAEESEAIHAALAAGATPYVSDIELSRVPAEPFPTPSEP